MTGLRPGACCVLAALLLIALPSAAHADQFLVNSPNDGADASPGNGTCAIPSAGPAVCTLRAAIQEASAGVNLGQEDDILVPAGTYQLTVGAVNEDTGAGGDLDVNDGDTIQGIDGAASTQVIQTLADRVFHVRPTSQNNPAAAISGLRISGGQLGGVQTSGGPAANGTLTLFDSTVEGNTHDAGSFMGGGIEVDQGTVTPELTLVRSTINGNEADQGGGIGIQDGAEAVIQNSTISGNTANDDGGGVFGNNVNGSPEGRATIANSTITGNLAPDGRGGGLWLDQPNSFTVEETILADNLGGNCNSATPASQGNNIDDADTCLLRGSGDRINTDPQLGPLLDNGGETQTHGLPAGSPAVDAIPAAACPPPGIDQRGVTRPNGPACDIGAYELVNSRTLPSLPDCSPTGTFTLQMDAPPGETPESFHYKVDGGPTQTVATGGSESANITLAEGRYQLEYWSETVQGGEDPQSGHLTGTALVDQTNPNLSVASDQSQDIYVITRTASVTIAAADPGAEPSGLTVNPTAQGEAVTTSSRGQKTATWTAVDLCGNQATQQFNYDVLGPGLGERAVIEPLGDGVQIDLPGGGARASQKGGDFQAVTQPREIPIGTRVDATEGRARITSSKSTTETDIQDGAFSAGIFQVLQSRRTSRNGLTTLELKGSNFRNCEAGAGGANAARLSRQARRRLRGNATGRFRTRGRHSAATVRGTKWTVTDRCDGTLTKVRRGRVAVRDFRLAKTITLTRGESYLAQAEPDPPVLGKTVNVEPVKGRVFVKLPRGGKFARASQKGATFVPLTEARSVPVRSILDTRKGTVALRTARNRKGKIQSGRFAAGVFQVLQSRKRREKGLTDVVLKGGAAKFNRCGRGKGSSASAHTSLSRRAIRRLRARARGRYRTRGRHSAATVRGTVWNMTDSCAGTLTTVKRGKVAVRDLRRKRTVVLTRGKSYLARPR